MNRCNFFWRQKELHGARLGEHQAKCIFVIVTETSQSGRKSNLLQLFTTMLARGMP